MEVWHLGNTTVRNPYRLRAALEALQKSTLQGNLIGTDQENKFAELLHFSEVVNVARIENGTGGDYSDLGRKWRSALSQLGFITHKISRSVDSVGVDPKIKKATDIIGLSGKPFEITPNGKRLIQSEISTLEQEAILRSLLAYQIPSVIETGYDCETFNPLKFVVDILFTIGDLGGEKQIAFDEFELFIQTSTPDNNIGIVAQKIIDYRSRKLTNVGRIKKFKNEEREIRVKEIYGNISDAETKGRTLKDYADLNLRYLKATGLFASKGRGIILSPLKTQLAQLIHDETATPLIGDEYLVNLWKGAKLPTDDTAKSNIISQAIERQIITLGESPVDTSGDDENTKRLKLEYQFEQLREWQYYKEQANQCEDIILWLEALETGRKIKVNDEYEIKIPQNEAPAYFEWIIWRAFLAINSLTNKPWEARRFKIDQDFLPIHHAPGSGPDMIFEFDDFAIVVEVTLTTSSRQEAAEGEPVRRHVARYLEQSNKPVYGLFIAVNIDTNTANTFKMGEWYLSNDTKLNLDIVPVKLNDFYKVFTYGVNNLSMMPNFVRSLLIESRSESHLDAPIWKNKISQIIEDKTAA
jgi:hypothetical protein